MRILQVTGSSAGGVGRHAREACAVLAAVGHQVMLAAPAEVLAPLPTEQPGARVRTIPLDIADRPRPREDAAVIRTLRKLAAGADVVHAHGLRAGALAVAAVRSLKDRPRLVVTLHNKPVGSTAIRAVGEGLMTAVALGADYVLGVSPDLVDAARRHGARNVDYALVPAPPRIRQAAERAAEDDVEAAPQWGTGVPSVDQEAAAAWRRGSATQDEDADAPLTILTVARLAPQKGLDLLVEATRLLVERDDVPAFQWNVAGDGPLLDELRADAAGLPITALGRREDIGDLMAGADIVVNTSVWEGQPLVVQEALAAGAAIVATDVGGTGEVARGGAQLVPYDAIALSSAIASLLRDPQRRENLRYAARVRAAQLPTAADLAAQLDDVYRA